MCAKLSITCVKILQPLKKFSKNLLKITIHSIKNKLNGLNDNGHISDRLFRHLKLDDDSKQGKFKIMPKLHKPKFGIIPLVASIDHSTMPICFVIDFIFVNQL